MHNLTTLIKRLEAATSRLEDLTTIAPGPTLAPSPAPAPEPVAPVKPEEPLPPSINDYDDLIKNQVARYVQQSTELGGLIAAQAKAVEACYTEQRKFLAITTKAKKPEMGSQIFTDLVSGMQAQMTEVSNIREANRADKDVYNHLSTVSEGIPGLAWVTVDGKPADFVGEMVGAAKYYGNKVLSEYKGKDQKHVDWVNSYTSLLQALQEYVSKHYKMGVVWNANGIDAAQALKNHTGASKPAAPSGGAPPPPPPPPPGPPPVLSIDGPTKPAGGDMGSVFAELNRGEGVTAGLRKVDKSEMTHKNPDLRGSSMVPARPSSSGSLRAKSPAPPHKNKPAHLTKKKPPKTELDGNKWVIEHYENEHNIVISETEINQSIFIFRCKNATIQVKGKVNTISLNECVKTNVVADSLVSSIDVIKCNGFALQVMNQIPTIQVDQCDGGTIYVPRESPNVEVFTSKSTAININIPEVDGDDYVEKAAPEQIKHTVKDGQLISEIVEHAG
ncbi:hypothetical protein EX30DRAFT_316737 [Ascodesmis nigricans]|uniref:Adenylyl cyclase-associated protein n=1 Tax=Ascodesmis nigricans TaxID=341454 RepID=A0A4S2N1G6_9PEZI|nr:hypothetical protein EX30DRAFT_316737 [Ascodesmis nigricans]